MKTERFVRFNIHVQEITFTHLISNGAQLYKENKNIKCNMFICNGSKYYIEELYQQMKG